MVTERIIVAVMVRPSLHDVASEATRYATIATKRKWRPCHVDNQNPRGARCNNGVIVALPCKAKDQGDQLSHVPRLVILQFDTLENHETYHALHNIDNPKARSITMTLHHKLPYFHPLHILKVPQYDCARTHQSIFSCEVKPGSKHYEYR